MQHESMNQHINFPANSLCFVEICNPFVINVYIEINGANECIFNFCGTLSLIPRLLYGKMQRLTGTGSGGRAGVGVRRAVVLRFLASCPQQEIQIFMDLILAPFKHLCTGK